MVWPWDDRPFVIAAPVMREGRILGAAVTVTPTTRVRGEVAEQLLLLGGGGLIAVLMMACAVVVPVVRWVLRPLRVLNEATHQVASGCLTSHVSERQQALEVRTLVASFNAMADSVTASSGRLRDFIAQGAHHLRNPLTALRLRVENAMPYLSDPDGNRELGMALEEIDRLSLTVDALLMLSRAEEFNAKPENVDVTAGVRRRTEVWRTAYDCGGSPLVVRVPDDVLVRCPAGLLDHVLDALLDNALKFGPGAPVEVSVRRRQGMVDIVVRDHGKGLTEEELGRVGERFWRSPRHQNIPGTGLGLAIVRTLVGGCGGSLELEPGRPRGLQARVRLPEAQPDVTYARGDTSGQRPDEARAERSR